MQQRLRGAVEVAGRLDIPPDKSISHRAAIFGAIAEGESTFSNFLDGADCLSTVACLRALGVDLAVDDDGTLRVRGGGFDGLREPADVLDCDNSGTTMRLLSGLLAGRPFHSILSGDPSLRARPMRRIAEPLGLMGATIGTTVAGTAPLSIRGGALHGITWESRVASAQVKTALLLAGMQAEGTTVIAEPAVSRDHSERMLGAMGADVIFEKGQTMRTSISRATRLGPLQMRIPGDFSSAAPWIVAAACHPESDLLLTGVGLNPTRTGLLDALRAMGASVEVLEERSQGGEPVGDLRVQSARMEGVEVGAELVARAIDELPLLALAATQANGRTLVSGAGELKVKESDRVETTAAVLRALGADIETREDGWKIEGATRLRGNEVSTFGDHRIAFLAGVSALLAEEETVIDGGECAMVSYPSFWQDLETIAASGERVGHG